MSFETKRRKVEDNNLVYSKPTARTPIQPRIAPTEAPKPLICSPQDLFYYIATHQREHFSKQEVLQLLNTLNNMLKPQVDSQCSYIS
jgi:hypothetical protein